MGQLNPVNFDVVQCPWAKVFPKLKGPFISTLGPIISKMAHPGGLLPYTLFIDSFGKKGGRGTTEQCTR
jgi:hypothetical protein